MLLGDERGGTRSLSRRSSATSACARDTKPVRLCNAVAFHPPSRRPPRRAEGEGSRADAAGSLADVPRGAREARAGPLRGFRGARPGARASARARVLLFTLADWPRPRRFFVMDARRRLHDFRSLVVRRTRHVRWRSKGDPRSGARGGRAEAVERSLDLARHLRESFSKVRARRPPSGARETPPLAWFSPSRGVTELFERPRHGRLARRWPLARPVPRSPPRRASSIVLVSIRR